ncbi:MAG: sigma-54-dependent Fis family transcriptional regulator, partial [Verrucomicrobia bacterium]|nr:sigma-54-dependent Fis family transcriptional regulator [Verrucomicrobiota bacterium]
QYRWPGNVRELENALQRAWVVAKGEALLPADLPPEIGDVCPRDPTPAAPQKERPGLPATLSPRVGASAQTSDIGLLARALFQWARQGSGRKIIAAVERELVVQALLESQGNQVQAAKLLGITRATLRKRVEKFDIRQQLNIL